MAEEDASEFYAAGGVPYAEELLRNENGNARALLFNAVTVLSRDTTFLNGSGPAIRYDSFRNQAVVSAPLPWDETGIIPRPWTDQDDREVTAWLQTKGITVGELVAGSAVQAIAERNKFHPVMDYLNGLSWDGEPRLDEWLITYCGAEDTPYTRAVGSKWPISGVARIIQPGCQADCVLVLEGAQGIRKTTTFSIWGGPYYTSDIAALGTKDAQEQILGKWVVELDELQAVTRASDVQAVGSFVSRRVDDFRLPYARRSRAHPRQCIFGGTTNRETWMRDETGGRRWWPVACGESIDIDGLREVRDQLWAEARDRFMASEPWWLDTPELVGAAQQQQEKRYEADPWEEILISRLVDSGKSPESGVTLNDVLMAMNVPIDRRTKNDGARAHTIVRHLKWARLPILDFYGNTTWKYFAPRKG